MEKYAISVTNVEFTTNVELGLHELIMDEPVQLGGQDKGASPYELLFAALASCTGITLRMYANRKKWPLEKVVIEVSHKNEYIQDLENHNSSDARIDVFERRIRVHGALSNEQIYRLGEIADKCPVHKTLAGQARIRTIIGD